MKRALVTGATGFVGQHLVKKLLENNFEVITYGRRSPKISGTKLHIPGDILDKDLFAQAISTSEYVFHLAGLIAYQRHLRPQMERVNVEGTRNFVDGLRKSQRLEKAFYMSSVAAIGASFQPTPLNEDSQFRIGELDLGYFETKRRAEELVVNASQSTRLPLYLANPSTIYGPGDFEKNSRSFQLKVAQGKILFYPPGGVNVVHIEDVTEAILKILEIGQPGRRYILSSENLTIKELFQTIAEIAGKKPPRVLLPQGLLKILGRTGDLINQINPATTSLSVENANTSCLFHWFDNLRARTELGVTFRPAKVAIQDSLDWAKAQRLIH